MPAELEISEVNGSPPGSGNSGRHTTLLLFAASTAALYFELVVIRYLASEIRIFAYLKNMPLIASFFGIGLGMILGRPTLRIQRRMPVLAAILFVLIANAAALNLTQVPMPTSDYWQFSFGEVPAVSFLTVIFIVAVFYFLALLVGVFVVLGGFIGELLGKLPQLTAYGINLLGSLAGIALFTLLSFLGTPPWVWLLVGFLLLTPFFARDYRALAIFALIVAAVGFSRPRSLWSPYYQIVVQQYPTPAGWPRPSGFSLSVDHDYFQKPLDLSPEFLRQNPDVEPNRTAFPHYELPYRLLPHPPGSVLVVGAGTGNDVAAALRHGAQQVDAVEIDPVILRLGRQLHPEHPYSSPRVHAYTDDARAFFRKTRNRYDLIVFGYLDSHTMLSAYSSVRLENNVYTLQSLQEAKRLLQPGGTMVLAFAAGKSFVSTRLYHMMQAVFGAPPLAFYTAYDTAGLVLVEGSGLHASAAGFPEVGDLIAKSTTPVILATDHWPFLFLARRMVPVSVLLALLVFLAFAAWLCGRKLQMRRVANPELLHMFFLGAGFLLLETKGVTELSLLFGATWITNTVVISAFLIMAIAANVVVMFHALSYRLAYSFLFLSLLVAGFFPYASLAGWPWLPRIVAAGGLVALPVFFSGLIFSRSFQLCRQPSQALGMNLLGAVIGGVLENAVMVGGTMVLGVIAIVLYAVAGVALLMHERAPAKREAAVSLG